MSPPKGPLRKSRMTGRTYRLKTHPNVLGKEHVLMSPHGHDLRDLIAHGLNEKRKQGVPNRDIIDEYARRRSKDETVSAVTKDPLRHRNRIMLRKLKELARKGRQP